jgi:uncharacterized Zn finger protein
LESENKEIWWYDAFYQKLYKDSNITKFNLGRKLFNKRAITYLSIERNEIEAVVFDGKKNFYDVKIHFAMLSYNEIQSLIPVFKENMHFAVDLINGVFPGELNECMKDRSIDIFPSWDDLTYKCSCRKAKKCEHTATVLHRIFNETIFEPLLLFNLRGLENKDLFSIFMNDPDFKLSEKKLPEEMCIENYKVKSSDFTTTGIDPSNYYGVEIPETDMSEIKESRLTCSKVFHGKIRDEFYELYDSMSEILKINTKKF